MKKELFFLIIFSFNSILFSQEYCDSALPQCHVCDAATDEDLEIVGYEDDSYLVDEIFVKVNPILLPNINPATADFSNVQINNLSDSYGLKGIERMGETDYYLLEFNNIKDLQCTIDGFLGLVDEISQVSYFDEVLPNIVIESSSISSDNGNQNLLVNSSKFIDQNNSTKLKNQTDKIIAFENPVFVEPKAYSFSAQWHLKNVNNPLADIDARRAWAITKGSSEVNVLFVDNFFSYKYPKNSLRNRLPFIHQAEIYSDALPTPHIPFFIKEGDNGCHGDSVFNTFGSDGMDDSSVAITGVDVNSKISFAEISGINKRYNYKEKRLEEGVFITNKLVWNAFKKYNDLSMNFNVVNNSWAGGKRFNYTFQVKEIIKFVENNPNCLIVSGAGNNYSLINSNWSNFEEIKKNLIIVGGSNKNDGIYYVSEGNGSNYGSEVDVVAPGQEIYSEEYIYDQTENTIIPKISYSNGTSLSTPIVTGIASLIYSLQDETQKAFTALEVKDMIITTAEKYMFYMSKKINEDLKIASFPSQRDEKFANGRVNAHQAVLLSAAHLNFYKGQSNQYILKATDNTDPLVFSLPYDKVLFDSNGANRKYALMLNRHKFSTYRLPSDLEGPDGTLVHSNGGLLWENNFNSPSSRDFDNNFYAKELKLSGENLQLLTVNGRVSWSVQIPIIQYLDLGNDNEATQCKIVPVGGASQERIEVCTKKAERDEHNNLGLDNGHFVSQKLALAPTSGDLIVVRIYKNRAGEELEVVSWSSSSGQISHDDQVHRHLLQNDTIGCTEEVQGNFLASGVQLKQNQCMYSSDDRNYRVILLGNELITQRKITDDDGTGVGQTIYEDVSNYNLN